MKIYNVLVSGTGSYGVGEGLIKVINSSAFRSQIKLIGASNSNLTAFKGMLDGYFQLPSAASGDYLEKLHNLLINEKIDIMIPGSEAEIRTISANRDYLGSIDIWINDHNIIEIFDNKFKANDFFISNGFSVPKVYNNKINEIEYPVIFKPVYGKSSEGLYIVNINQQFKAVENLFNTFGTEYLVQKYINFKNEYTISLINVGSDYQEVFIMKRILNKGATQYSIYVDNIALKEITLKLHQCLKHELVLNIQIIEDDDQFYILEVNPRFSGSAPMRALLGFNEFDIIFAKKYLNRTFEYVIRKDSHVIRGYSEFLYQYNV